MTTHTFGELRALQETCVATIVHRTTGSPGVPSRRSRQLCHALVLFHIFQAAPDHLAAMRMLWRQAETLTAASN